MESKIRKEAGTGTTAALRAAEMVVQMAQGKARTAAEQVQRMRQKAKAAKKALKQAKKSARRTKKSLKAAQTALEVAQTKLVKEEVRKPEPASPAIRPAIVRPRKKRQALKKAYGEDAFRSPEEGTRPAGHLAVATSIAPESDKARP